ncbi:MAG: tetratricopeptide repeat protein, partial [Chloroflexota bacterium]
VDATDAGVLKDIVPDIEQLLEITAGAVVQLQGPDYQQRLVTAIVNLFRGYNQPILLMLEDLQWAEESLSVLEALYNMYTELPIVIVGSYRHEEKPDLAETFAGARALNLKRLTDTAIARISVSMLGDAGSRPDVVKLLKDETAGNIYFMIEVIRALAEEAGDLSKIAYMDLPQTVAAGGIQDVLARRLKNVPSNVYDVLQIYALGGRDLDLNLLPHIVPGMPVDNFLAVCTNCAVLESLDEQWHFSHGRLRDAVEDTIDEDARRAMHRTLALAIEAAYPDAPEQAGMLAYQWQMANDHAKELHYQQVAGQYALRVSALSEAVTHFWRAVELLPADEDATRIDLLIKLSEAEKYMGNYDSATQHAEMALAVARKIDDGSRIAHAEQELSDVQFQLGNYDAAMAHGESSLTRYREQNDPQGTAKILSHMGQIHNQRGEFAQAAELGEESIRISEALSDDDVTSIKTLTRLGITYFSMGRWDDASRNFSRGLELSRKNNERRWVANALLNLGNVYSFSGDFDRAQEHYEECLDIVQKIGDLRVQASALNNLGYDNMLREAYETAQEFFEAALHVMKRIDNRYEVANTYANMGQVAEKQGNVEQARAY